MTKYFLPLACLLVGIGIAWIAKPFLLEKVATPLVAKSSADNSQASLDSDSVTSAESPNVRGKASATRPSQDTSRAMSEEQKEIEELNKLRKKDARLLTDRQRKNFEAFFPKRSSQLKLTSDQEAKINAIMKQYFSEKEERYVLSPDDYVEKANEYSALINGNGLEEFAAALLTDEQKSIFDSMKTKERERLINSKALVDLGNLVTILDLTEEQKDAAHGVLFELAVAHNKNSAESESLRGVFEEGYGIKIGDEFGINSIMEAFYNSDSGPGEEFEKATTETISKRIVEKVEAMRPFLTEPQLQKYRKHLETTATDEMNSQDLGAFSFETE